MTGMNEQRPAITARLSAYAAEARFTDLPAGVRAEAVRAFLNWLGCALGGCREPAVDIAVASLGAVCGNCRLIGRNAKADIASAAFVNCLASSVLAYDDTHLATVTHPTGPVAAPLLAYSETARITGEAFLAALAVGIEIQCRISNVLLLPPAAANLGLYITGVTGPIGAAAALGRAMGFDAVRMCSAMGLGAAHGSGFRGTHGSMAGHVVPAIGARGGTFAALLAAQGFECSADALESERGFVAEFSAGADLRRAIVGLGTNFELLANAYKPYPGGIVVHPTIDACREIAERRDRAAPIMRVRLSLHPLGLALGDRVAPGNATDAQISQQHWAAAVLLGHAPGPAVLQPACLSDDDVGRLRSLIELVADDTLARDEAVAEVWYGTATEPLRAHIPHARGSLARPMTDAELDRKFLDQAQPVLGQDCAARLLRTCRDLASVDDVGAALTARIGA